MKTTCNNITWPAVLIEKKCMKRASSQGSLDSLKIQPIEDTQSVQISRPVISLMINQRQCLPVMRVCMRLNKWEYSLSCTVNRKIFPISKVISCKQKDKLQKTNCITNLASRNLIVIRVDIKK